MISYQILCNTILVRFDKDIPNLEMLVDELNETINSILYNVGLIKETDVIRRARVKDFNLISVDGHATFKPKHALELLKSVMYERGFIAWKEVDIYSILTPDIKDTIPYQNLAKGTSSGGGNEDESGIDKHIEVLVDTLNNIEGVETFSSCDGHYVSPYYVLWFHRDNNIETVFDIVIKLETISNDVLIEMDLPTEVLTNIRFDCMIGKDNWAGGMSRDSKRPYTGCYFEFRAQVNWDQLKDKELFYIIAEKISENFKKSFTK